MRLVSARALTAKRCVCLIVAVVCSVVGGLDVLRAWEAMPVDAKDRPQRPLVIEKMHIFKNAFDEASQQLQKKKEEEANKDIVAAKVGADSHLFR